VKGTAGAIVETARTRTAESIGIEVIGGAAIALIGAGSRLPVARTMTFTTVADGQRAIEVRVVRARGGRRVGAPVGRFVLAGLRPVPRGEARIDIGLSLDAAGVLRAWGVDRSTGARQEATFPGGWALGAEGRAEALRELEALLARSPGLSENAGELPSRDREMALVALVGEMGLSATPVLRRGDAHAS
jgi:molecular chaperone DnaK (HSP70)